MKIKYSLIIMLSLVLVIGMNVSAYEPSYDFGNVNFEGATVTFLGPEFLINEGRLEEAKERFNIGGFEVLWPGWGQPLVDTAMSRLMSGEAGYDFWWLPQEFVLKPLTQNGLYPINQLVSDEFYDNKPEPIQEIAENFTFNGNTYYFSNADDFYATTSVIAWNKDLFEREGLTPLDEIYNSGEWDWNAFEEIAVNAITDTDGDNEVDQWGINSLGWETWAFANGAKVTRKDENGNIMFSFNDDKAFNAMERLREWTQLGISSGGGHEREDFFDGKTAMAAAPIYQLQADATSDEGANFSWGIVPIPKGPDTDEYKYPSGGVDSLVLPIGVEKPEAMLALDAFLFRNEDYWRGKEEYIQFAPDRTSHEVLQNAINEWSGEAYWLESVLGPFWDGNRNFGGAMREIVYGDKSPATALGEAAPAIQAEINKFFDQFNQ